MNYTDPDPHQNPLEGYNPTLYALPGEDGCLWWEADCDDIPRTPLGQDARIAYWEALRGDLPPNTDLWPACDQPSRCVDPEHMDLFRQGRSNQKIVARIDVTRTPPHYRNARFEEFVPRSLQNHPTPYRVMLTCNTRVLYCGHYATQAEADMYAALHRRVHLYSSHPCHKIPEKDDRE